MSVLVTGMGVVSALGIGVENNFNKLANEQTGISEFGSNNLIEPSTLVGKVERSNDELKSVLNIDADKTVSRSALLGLLAAKEALGNTATLKFKTGFINGATVGGMDLTEQYFFNKTKGIESNDYSWVANHDLGASTNFIAEELNITHYVNTISTACSSATNSIMLGARMIEAGLLDRVVVGGADAITQFTVNGFNSLMIYSDALCQPFDVNRTGLNLGEGAGYLLLESKESQQASKNKVLAELSGWCNANDAFHQTGSSPNGEGAVLSMNGALNKANLEAEDIQYVNAHGTATVNNDDSESVAFLNVFGNSSDTKISSTKGFTGHTLAASGGVEAVFSLIALKHQMAIKNLNLKQPIPAIDQNVVANTNLNFPIQNVMTNAFGFGGNTSTLIFSKN